MSDKRFGKRRKRSSISIQRIRTTILYGLIGLALVVVVIYLNLQSEQRKHKLRDQDDIVDLNTAEITFDQIVERSNIDQLINMSDELSDATDDAPLMRLDRISKQIAISNQILQLEPDNHSRARVISSKLKQLMDRAQIIANQEIYSDTATAELSQFAAEYSDCEDVSISRQAKTGIAIASICEFLSTAPSEQRNELAIEVLEKLKLAAQFSPQDVNVAKQLHDWLQIVRKQGKPEESRLFFSAWSEVYAKSSDGRIVSLVNQIGNVSELSEVELVDISESVFSNRDDVVRQLLDQVDAAFDQKEVSTATVQFALQRATELLSLGRVDAARAIRAKLEQSVTDLASEINNRELAKLARRLNLFESQLEISSFTDVHSKPVKFNLADAKFRILYFVSDVMNGETMPKFTKLIETVRRELLRSNLEIVVIYLDYGNDSESLELIKNLAAQNFQWQVWLLTTSTAEGQKFLDKLPVEKSPYIVILDNDNRTIALDPSIFQIEEIVFSTRANDNK